MKFKVKFKLIHLTLSKRNPEESRLSESENRCTRSQSIRRPPKRPDSQSKNTGTSVTTCICSKEKEN